MLPTWVDVSVEDVEVRMGLLRDSVGDTAFAGRSSYLGCSTSRRQVFCAGQQCGALDLVGTGWREEELC